MSGARAAIRYAKALLSLASDQNNIDAVHADMKLIAHTISKNGALNQALHSPVVPSSVKKSILLQIFKTSHKTTTSLINTLIVNNRIDILEQVAVKYNALFDASRGVQLAIVTTAIPLTPSLEKKVLAKAKELSGKNVEIENRVDENILGGFILRIGDVQYNASVLNQLNKLKKEFTLN